MQPVSVMTVEFAVQGKAQLLTEVQVFQTQTIWHFLITMIILLSLMIFFTHHINTLKYFIRKLKTIFHPFTVFLLPQVKAQSILVEKQKAIFVF
jgi:hypothetical protein